MAVLDGKKTYKNLKKKGFSDAENRSPDHKCLDYYYDGKLIAFTKISHGAKDLGDSLIKAMAKQCLINKQQFMDLANCPLSKEEYLEILKENGDLE